MKSNGTKNYVIRKMPEELWKRVRHLAIDEGMTLRQICIEALTMYLNTLELNKAKALKTAAAPKEEKKKK